MTGRRQTGERAIEPAAVAGAGFRQPAFQQILAVEMRAFAIGRRRGVYDDRLLRREHAMQIAHRRMEREEAVELERGHPAIEGKRIVAAQRDPVRIADRGDRRQPVERAAQDDREKARIAPLGMGKLGPICPGEQRAGGKQHFAA